MKDNGTQGTRPINFDLIKALIRSLAGIPIPCISSRITTVIPISEENQPKGGSHLRVRTDPHIRGSVEIGSNSIAIGGPKPSLEDHDPNDPPPGLTQFTMLSRRVRLNDIAGHCFPAGCDHNLWLYYGLELAYLKAGRRCVRSAGGALGVITRGEPYAPAPGPAGSTNRNQVSDTLNYSSKECKDTEMCRLCRPAAPAPPAPPGARLLR
ncbi:hypothetical protein EVAR_100681_1 [Eumeta japonica]|uniref:Uncharacterized protein n=1 Tax=Eumeta variegata TaxID=151549 RepID=A0A4C1ZST2_EUMVA|nr:hypothetical protein EVAR_100681_1 [Eumeta japonica]